MRPSELGTWAALWRTDPRGPWRDDLRVGVLAALIANVHRDPRRRSEPFVPAEFMPFEKRPTSELGERIRSAFKALSRKDGT